MIRCLWGKRSFSSSRMILTASKTSTTHSTYSQKLHEYFQTTKFSLLPEKPEQSIADLKTAMQTVYLREKPLVAFDVEAYERSLNKVTEIGIAIYDPKALEHSIMPVIKLTHLIIKEHKRMLNGKFCPDNKLRFMGGKSYMVSISDTKEILTSILEEYINHRNGAFVGHHIEGDIKWLKGLGIPIQDAPIVDSSRLYTLSRRRGGTLRGVLRLLDIPHGYLHNAGNDAYYTLLASMALCDPEVRRSKNLDTFVENEKLKPQETRVQKFSDSALYVNGTNQQVINTFVESQ